MSQYLNFTLKHKSSAVSLSLGYFCTTPARQMADAGAFPYTENDTQLSEDLIHSYINILKEELKGSRQFLEKYLKQKSEYQESLYKCTSKEVAEMLLDMISDIDLSLKDLQEDVEDWEWRINKISVILEIYEDNKSEWDLYYTNC